MSEKTIRNIAASVRDRLLRIARNRGENYQLLLNRYALERLMYRLSESPYRDQFVLKGAMLFVMWEKDTYRPTRDIDFLMFGESERENLVKVFRELCKLKVIDDGIIFILESVRAEPIRDEIDYGGIRVKLEGRLAEARISIQADIGFGDAVTPAPERITYPTLLDGPAPTLNAYPKESVVSEKLQAMVHLGIANSRMKDFYDIWIIAQRLDFNGQQLTRAIEATFERRGTPFPAEIPLALTEEFGEDPQKTTQWIAFLSRGRLTVDAQSLAGVCIFLQGFLWPPLECLAQGKQFRLVWPPGGPWQPGSKRRTLSESARER